MEIQITATKNEGAERRLQVSVPPSRVAEARNKAAGRVAKQVRIPGFRPGKAPAAMIRKQYAQAIDQEAVEALLREAFEAVLAKEKLDLVTQPHAHDVKFGADEGLSFELHCEVRPEIKLDRLSGFRVMRPTDAVTDHQVQEQLDQMRDQRAAWSPAEGKPLEGDLVTVLLATADEDGTMPEGKDYRLVMGAGQAIAAIEEVVMTLAQGETTEQSVKWPDDFPDEAQRGKTKMVRATLTEVKRKSLPPLDDAFAREMGDFESLEAFTRVVRTDMAESAVREADSAARAQLVDEVVAANPFDLPPSWVKQMVQAYAEAYKVPPEELVKFADEVKGMAERQVRRDLILDTIAGREKLAATEGDVDDKVAALAAKRGIEPGQLYASFQKAGRLRELERSITEERVFTWLLGQNSVEQA